MDVRAEQDDSSASKIYCDKITAKNADHYLRLNYVQVLGTHNSYECPPHPDHVSIELIKKRLLREYQ